MAHYRAGCGNMYDDVIRMREEISQQLKALNGMKEMAKAYGYDISKPARNAKEAVQWLYFGYLAAVKTQNGAAMSVGRISTFLDIYIQRDLQNGKICSYSGIQSVILWRPYLGYSGSRRYKSGWQTHGYKD